MPQPPVWKVVLAFIIDLFLSFFIIGYSVALVTGGTTASGFNLEGIPALIAFALIILYFVIMHKVVHWTIGKKMLRIA